MSVLRAAALAGSTAVGAQGSGTAQGSGNVPGDGTPAAGPAGRVRIIRVAPPDRTGRTVAFSVVAGAAGLAVLVTAAALAIPAGRSRHWRPGLPSS
jgi:hypothetical protein